ncbi:MAG: hypothetical protein AAF602_19930 [Myxococcota bacterium]
MARTSLLRTGVAPPTSDAPRASVARTRRLTWWRQPASERRRLLDACYAIYRETSSTLSRCELEAQFAHPETRLGLFYDKAGALVGFSNAAVLRIDVAGRSQAVFSAGVYFRLSVRGGPASVVFGLTEALRYKLLAPYVPLAYLAMASSPAPYDLYYRHAKRLWPSPDAEMPPSVAAAIEAASEARGLRRIDGDRCRVETYVAPDRPDRIRRSKRLRGQPSTRFYEAANPGWADHERPTALLVWIPLGLRDILGALLRLVGLRRR